MGSPAVERMHRKQPFRRAEFPQVVEVLRAAKGSLSNGDAVGRLDKTAYICTAIRLHAPPACDSSIGDRLTSMIMARLDGSVSVTQWLGKQGFYDTRSRDARWISSESAQAYRHRWLDALIKEFGG